MAALTLDASAAVNVALDTVKHRVMYDRLVDADSVYAPALFVTETANALWKYVKAKHLDEESALRMHRETNAMVDRLVDDASLFPEALALAARLRHPVYDTVYMVVARRTESTLMTFDAKLARHARTLDIDVIAP
jgi:predicted nucleic acid-binding protein